jgi:serine/threonine protein kinase/tetratricopeptide (TPR) repeat protein
VSLTNPELNLLSRLLDEALAMPEEALDSWLSSLTEPDAKVLAKLREMLASRSAMEANEFLKTLPPLVLARTLEAAAASQVGLQPGTCIGPYELIHVLGGGGMGSVWLAIRNDGSVNRRIALKLPFSAVHSALLAERFARERDILSTLAHPNIARLYDAGITTTGQPYLALEFVDGVPLTQYCEGQQLPIRARLEQFLQVLTAVQYAHSHLVIHRDLKPSNILVTAQGQVMLLDFGIAKLMTGGEAKETELTQQGGRALTLDYASPEQILGQPVTTASDVYSLGIVLFELLTGERPYKLKRNSRGALEEAVLSLEALAPSQAIGSGERVQAASFKKLHKELAGDLDTIALKALKKRPADRYQTVTDLSDDLSRYLRGEPVRARPDSRAYRSRKFIARHKLGVGTSIAVVVLLAVGLSIVTWQARRLAEQRDIARSALTREEAVRSYLTGMFRASAGKHGEDPPNAKTMLDASAKRVLTEYRNEPYLSGKVVEALADLYSALEDTEGQVPLLNGFLTQAGSSADPEAVAGVERRLAEVELLRNNPAHAAELLDAAESYWQKTPSLHMEDRLIALKLRGILQSDLGDKEAAVKSFERALQARIAFSGVNNHETAELYNSMALSLSGLYRGAQAQEAYRQALDILRNLGQADTLDAVVILGNSGDLALRMGRLAEATAALHAAFEKGRAIAGDSAAIAVYMSLYGSALNIYGRYGDAIGTLREASPIAERYAGANSIPDLRVRRFLAHALWGSGQHSAARTLYLQTLAASRAHIGDSHPFTLGLRSDGVRFALSEGETKNAEAELADIIAQCRKLGTRGLANLAQDLVLQGELRLSESHPSDAVAPLREAAEIRERTQWSESWELAEARARLAEAYVSLHDSRGIALLERAVQVLESQLGSAHEETERVRRALNVARGLGDSAATHVARTPK